VPVSFKNIIVGHKYSRNDLAALWGYASYHALARGIVTPQYDNKIIVFITEIKQDSSRQYVDRLVGDILETEGPDDHFAEDRIASAASTGDEIHLFHRQIHHTDFTYKGRMKLLELKRNAKAPSKFTYQLV
jgi:hypothetical protein